MRVTALKLFERVTAECVHTDEELLLLVITLVGTLTLTVLHAHRY